MFVSRTSFMNLRDLSPRVFGKDIYNVTVEARVFSSDDEVAGNTEIMRDLQVVENEGVGNFAEKMSYE